MPGAGPSILPGSLMEPLQCPSARDEEEGRAPGPSSLLPLSFGQSRQTLTLFLIF